MLIFKPTTYCVFKGETQLDNMGAVHLLKQLIFSGLEPCRRDTIAFFTMLAGSSSLKLLARK